MIVFLIAASLLSYLYSTQSTDGPVLSLQAKQLALNKSIREDEEVLFYRTHGALSENGENWLIPIHGIIYEPEKTSEWRQILIKSLSKILGGTKSEHEKNNFNERTAHFLVDNEGNKLLHFNLGGAIHRVGPSSSNGHFYANIEIPIEKLRASKVSFEVLISKTDNRNLAGDIELIKDNGLIIISDIDDTIKDSSVLDKKKLLKKTFYKDFQAVDNMSALYQSWQKQGASFHYVSSSPWQLYTVIDDFMREQKFPKGEMHLKTFRLKDKSFLDMFKSPMKTKVPTIAGIIKKYPKSNYILVGDSGESDPEAYGEIFKNYSARISHIYIRKAPEDESSADRFKLVFKNIPKDKWTLFDHAEEIIML